MRRAFKLTLPPLERQTPKRIVLLRAYRLLTPLFGGGVRAGEVDTTTPIRATAVRGQLRFWWRATRGGEFAGVAAMKQREDAVWGSTGGASPVAITVLKANPGQVYTRARNSHGKAIPIGEPASDHSYVAFPLRGKEPGKVHEGVTFTLRIDFPPGCRFDVQAALWAWETFGGIGARTRRGFGTLECVSVKLDPESAPENETDWRWVYPCENAAARLAEDIDGFVSASDFPAGVPYLSRNPERFRVVLRSGDAVATWQWLFNKLKDFRQDRQGRFGRSNWPEPDEIRRLTGQSLPAHATPTHSPQVHKFPRAAFGLPIIFEFKREQSHPTRRDMDPRLTTLQGAQDRRDRLASPLILKPLPCDADRFVGLVVVLEGCRPWNMPGGMILKDAPSNPAVHADVTEIEASSIKKKTRHYEGNPDVLQDFLDSL